MRWSVSPNPERVRDLAVQPDGKIVSFGEAQVRITNGTWDSDAMVARHHVDGTPDTSFGGDGVVVVDVVPDKLENATAGAVFPDGGIVVGGASSGEAGNAALLLARFQPDGSLDPSFGGGDGVVLESLQGSSTFLADVAFDGDGRVVVAGTIFPPGAGAQFFVARYAPDGTLDPAFGGGDGVVTTPFNESGASAKALAIQPDGKIVVVGHSAGFAVARYTSDGVLDPTFSDDGTSTGTFSSQFGQSALDVAVDTNDRIVVAGYTTGTSATAQRDFLAVSRYTGDGAFDTTFSGDGKVTVPSVILNAPDDSPGIYLGLVVQPDGKPVVGGRLAGNGSSAFSLFDIGAARLTASGALDASFSGDGVARFDAGPGDHGEAVAMDGRGVVVGGMTNKSGDAKATLVRFLAKLAASACPGMTITNTVAGTPGTDALVGTAGNDFIYGMGGDDTVSGGDGDDCIYAGGGDDEIDAGSGKDRVFGEFGNDILTGGVGVDKLNGGFGDDIIRIAAGDVPAALTEVTDGKQGTDTLELGTGLTTADVVGAPPTFTVSDPSTGGAYSVATLEIVTDT